MTTPDHWSFSQWSDFSGCGHRYKLKRVDGITEVPSVAAVAGKAFHSWTEIYDLGYQIGDPAAAWENFLEEEVSAEEGKTGIARDQWRVGGRSSKAKPNREDLTFWTFYGLELIEKYLLWVANTKWRIERDLPPDEYGRTRGVEYHLDVKFGGDQFIGFVDRISRDENGRLGVVDYKTGSRMRHTIQLGQYAAGCARRGITIQWGAYYDARRGVSTEPVDLLSWTPEKVETILAPQQFMRDNGIFPIVPGDHCDWCPVRQACDYHL